MHKELWVRFDEDFNGLFKQLHISAFGETNKGWNVVHRGGGLFHAIDIYAHLRVRQRSILGLRWSVVGI